MNPKQEAEALGDLLDAAMRKVIAACDHHQANVTSGLGIVTGGRLKQAIEDARGSIAAQGATNA